MAFLQEKLFAKLFEYVFDDCFSRARFEFWFAMSHKQVESLDEVVHSSL